MVGLGRFDIAFHKVVAAKMKLPDRFSICPPSSGIGKLTVGAGAPTKSDISGLMKTTPLIVNKPVSNQPFFSDNDPLQEYFIDAGRRLAACKTTPQCTRRSISAHPLRSVAAVGPFRACYSAETVKRTGARPEVPAIDLANAMVEVDRKTMCLAFVDASQLRFSHLGNKPAPPKKDFSRPAQQRQNEMRGEQGDQPRGKQPAVQTDAESGWNRVAVVNRKDIIPDTSLQIREPLLVLNSGMVDQHPSGKGRERKKRSPESRARYREKRRLRRLEEVEGRAMTETEGSEFETDDGGEFQSRTRSFSPTFRGNRTPNLETYMGLGVHSNSFDILEDDEPDTESSMDLVLHDGTADAQIIHEARRTKGVRIGAAGNGSLPMEIASDGDRRLVIKTPMKKARVSTSRSN
ncbi:hypothetical protein SASPL_144793 [Salvia splendens]|uniref:Xylanase inhibitor C-terminal domain-containing protein n=1 Tax=Salvia splendens TaxID=180675 RepID=A0A8X8Z6T7_SALSN|nr:hypothetical protein SASPL_144793 [Salvia splendens]